MTTSNMTPAEVQAWTHLAETGRLRAALALEPVKYARALKSAQQKEAVS